VAGAITGAMRTALLRGAALLVAALAGGGVAVGIGAAVWNGGGTTTIVREVQADAAPAPASFGNTGNGETIQQLYRNAAPAVVQVLSTQIVSDNPLFGPQEARALGSGFVIDKAGHIVTNYHVVQGAKDVHVSFSGKDQIPAKVVGVDPSTDVAVLEIDAQSRALTTLPLGNSDRVQVGDSVVAIGNPLGLDRTITAGIVSALQREITSPNGFAIDHVIQTDAAINHGNSGGPLLNTRGEVIGVNSQIATGGNDPNAGNIGIGFAVPINTVKDVVSQILLTGKVEHSFLGISMQDVDRTLTDNFRMPADHGVLIVSVRPGSPAAKAGLHGGRTRVVVNGQSYMLGGDVVTKVDGRPVTSADEIRSAVQAKKPGDTITLEIHRDKTVKTLTITLGRQPSVAAG
jgi:S1-C subfamily serine protease